MLFTSRVGVPAACRRRSCWRRASSSSSAKARFVYNYTIYKKKNDYHAYFFVLTFPQTSFGSQAVEPAGAVQTLTITQPDDWYEHRTSPAPPRGPRTPATGPPTRRPPGAAYPLRRRHLHVRDGAALASVVPFTAAVFRRAVIMPNLKPPVRTVADAEQYRCAPCRGRGCAHPPQPAFGRNPCSLRCGVCRFPSAPGAAFPHRGKKHGLARRGRRSARVLAAAAAAGGPAAGFEPLMALYLTDNTTAADVAAATASGFVAGFKYYPAGATTNSADGVTDISKARKRGNQPPDCEDLCLQRGGKGETPSPLLRFGGLELTAPGRPQVRGALEAMAEAGLPLMVHGEVTDAGTDIFDREARFVDTTLAPLLASLPGLRLCMEHITTREAKP